MYLFIDTNIFLSFYHLTSDDLEELKKLTVLLRNGRIQLLVPEQVMNEFHRNRENKIADALKRLRDQKLNLQFPQLCKDYEEYSRLRQLQKEYEQNHAELIKRISTDVKDEALKADITILELFTLATKVSTNNNILTCARNRVDLGNPPGKNGSLGDAINWETILETIPLQENLYFITDDQDYYSPLDENAFNAFLLQEWSRIKGSKLIYYKRLSLFFKENFPDIKLASEYEKDLQIRNLANSWSFAQTHSVIAKLSQYTDFSAAQINDIIEAAISNNQIYWIIDDPDVEEFLRGVIKGQEARIDPDKLRRLYELLPSLKPAEINEIPF